MNRHRIYWVNPDPNLRHGTTYAYYRRGCRCDDCYGAYRAYHERRKQQGPEYLAARNRAKQRSRARKAAS